MRTINSVVSALNRFAFDKSFRNKIFLEKGLYNRLPDDEYLKLAFNAYVGYDLNLDDPKTFNEKIQWLKLHSHHTEYTNMVDKYLVREYISRRIGSDYLIPLLGVWDKPEDIDFDKLPNQFVLKCNHNSGLGMYICKDKKTLNTREVINGLRKGLKQDYYIYSREWPYKNVIRKIIAEKYMCDDVQPDGIIDYKFMCFSGKVKCILVCSNRFSGTEMNETFFDCNWNVLPFYRKHAKKNPYEKKPENIDEMLRIAEKLAVSFPFVRIDFYEISGKTYFGEITFFPASGFEVFLPDEWDSILGSWITLPSNKEIVNE